MRNTIVLEKDWTFYKNPQSESGEAVTLPHTWNAVDGQDGGNDYYRGTCKYVRHFAKPELEKGGRAYLEFNGAAMTADVVVNGTKLFHHEGGFSTFRVDVTEQLTEDNLLEVYVDNSDNTKVYPQKADFTFYGGLYRMVKLVTVPKVHFVMDYAGGNGMKVTPEVTILDAAEKQADADVTVELWMTGEATDVTVAVAGETQTVPVENGYARAVFALKNVHLWDGVDDPYLYTAKAELPGGDVVERTFGCRSFKVDSREGFFLNGRSYPLRGVSRHQDRAGAGNALTYEMHREDMAIVRELGANTIRLAHYQHAQEFYDLCDENGIIVWAEIPYITMHMADGTENTLSQMKELIVQNYHHPSIVCWGLSNEITAASAVNEELLENHRRLNNLCHELDKTRPTVMADVFMLETDSPMLEIPDMNSYNLYFGWYIGELEQNDSFFDEYHSTYPDRVIGLSEYGADANPAYHSANPERGDYTEEYQCVYHEHMAKMIEERPYLWATHVWNLFDFAADGRDEGGKHGENQKGLVTMDRRIKKDAFYVYKAYWSKDAFVHLCGSRYTDRAEDVTEIKVYSNQKKVTLFVDGAEQETKEGARIFRFRVPITGTHTIRAVSGDCTDEITVRKVDAPNPDYIFNKQGDVVNWFDKEDFKADHYSISDTLGELAKNEMANAIVQRLMAQASASRGDVAESVKDNPALQRMMQRMTLASLLKQAGDAVSEEQMRALNDALQKIPMNEGTRSKERRGMKKAVQKIMLGTVTKNEKQTAETLRRIRAAGSDGIELNGFMVKPTSFLVRMLTKAAGMPVGKGGSYDWNALVKEAGLCVTSIHEDLGTIRREPETVAKEAEAFGTKYVVITGMYRFDYSDKAAVQGLCRDLNTSGKILKEAGIELLYHNHNCEFLHVEPQKTAYDLLLSETDPEYVNFELDSYWPTEAGVDALALMKKLDTRMKLYHINDRGTRLLKPAMTPILKSDSMELGCGNMNLDALIAQAKNVNVDAVILESHKNWVDNSPLRSLEVSAQFLNARI